MMRRRIKARRRVQMRSALLLTLGVWAASALARGLLGLPAMAAVPRGPALLLEGALTALIFGGGAYLGLGVLDGDHRRIVPLRRLSRAQMLWLSLLGVLCVCPMALAAELTGALVRGPGGAGAPAAPETGMLALRLLKSALVAPVCEELFFRGYLLCGLSGHGRARAAVISAACFAAVHGGNFAAYAVFGLLMGLLTLRTGSLLAPILAHACYNAALLVLSGAGLSALVTGGTILACTVQLAGCAALAAVLKRAYTARGAQGTFALWTGGRLTGREAAVLLAAAALLAGTMLGGGRL